MAVELLKEVEENSDNLQLVRIVPRKIGDGRPTPVRGTRVVMPDGTPIRGIRRIEIISELDDVWRARIELDVDVQDLPPMVAEFVASERDAD